MRMTGDDKDEPNCQRAQFGSGPVYNPLSRNNSIGLENEFVQGLLAPFTGLKGPVMLVAETSSYPLGQLNTSPDP